MRKKEIIRHFFRMKGVDEKENFMKNHDVKFTYDSSYHMIIWAEDGCLELYPTYRR